MVAFVPKRQLDSQSVNKEFKRLASGKTATFIAQIATADGSDPATTQALANATKAKVNALLTALIAAGLMAAS